MNFRGRPFGFSLIELLVVIVIIAIVSSIAVLSLGLVGDDRELQTAARRLSSLVEIAQDEAVMQGREFGLEVMVDSYRFVEFDPYANQWGELLGDDIFRTRTLPEDIEFELFLEDRRILLDNEPGDFDARDEFAIRDLSETYAPQIWIFSSGDMTPFELHILRKLANQSVVLRGDLTGAIEFVTDDD